MFDKDNMLKYYPDLNLKFFEKDNSVEEIKKYFISNKFYSYHNIYLFCNICNNSFNIKLRSFLYRLTTKYLNNLLTCQDKLCIRKKQQRINEYRKELGCAGGSYKVYTEEEKNKRLNTLKTSEKWLKSIKKRKGKSFKDQYGDKKAEEIKDKIKRNCKQHKGHLGKPHSEKTKKTMSDRKKVILNSVELTHISPLTNKKITFKQYVGEIRKINYKNKSQYEKILLRLKQSKAKSLIYGNTKRSNRGWHKAWWQEFIYSKYDQSYLSNYELDWYKILDDNKIYYKTNMSIYLPYIHPKDDEIHFYCPDVLIYENDKFKTLLEIQEVKPYEFAYNPKNNDSIYYIITKRKLDALKKFSIDNNLKYSIITEKEIYNENKKNNKKNI